MSRCPVCDHRLADVQDGGIPLQVCPVCAGTLVDVDHLPLLRHRHATVHSDGVRGQVSCPRCRRLMAQVPVPLDGQAFYLDHCSACGTYWFGRDELELVQALCEKEEAVARRA